MTKYFRMGSMQRLADDNDMPNPASSLNVGTHLVAVHPELGYILQDMQDMTIPSKVYGDVVAQADRIISTYESRESNTGVLLSGEKGSGKTMLLRTLSAKMRERGHPTLVINDKHHGDGFNKFIQRIDQPCMIAFDEFEKTYGPVDRYRDSDDTGAAQDAVLTLLDGVFRGKKLFVFTSNDTNKISKHMINRPGRLFYHLRYTHLDQKVIEQYIDERLHNKAHAQGLIMLATMIDSFQFDMLQAMVEEMNRYGEDARTAAIYLNIRPEGSVYSTYSYAVKHNGKPSDGSIRSSNPIKSGVHFAFNTGKKNSDNDDVYENIYFKPTELVSMINDVFTFKTKNEHGEFEVACTRERRNPYAF